MSAMTLRSRRPFGMSIVAAPPRAEQHLSAEELALAAGISPARLARLIRLGLVEPDAPEADRFSAAAAARLRRMLRLHSDLRLSLVAAAVVADLVERLDRMERELARLRGGA